MQINLFMRPFLCGGLEGFKLMMLIGVTYLEQEICYPNVVLVLSKTKTKTTGCQFHLFCISLVIY